MRTGRAGNWTTDLPISGRPSLPPEPHRHPSYEEPLGFRVLLGYFSMYTTGNTTAGLLTAVQLPLHLRHSLPGVALSQTWAVAQLQWPCVRLQHIVERSQVAPWWMTSCPRLMKTQTHGCNHIFEYKWKSISLCSHHQNNQCLARTFDLGVMKITHKKKTRSVAVGIRTIGPGQ